MDGVGEPPCQKAFSSVTSTHVSVPVVESSFWLSGLKSANQPYAVACEHLTRQHTLTQSAIVTADPGSFKVSACREIEAEFPGTTSVPRNGIKISLSLAGPLTPQIDPRCAMQTSFLAHRSGGIYGPSTLEDNWYHSHPHQTGIVDHCCRYEDREQDVIGEVGGKMIGRHSIRGVARRDFETHFTTAPRVRCTTSFLDSKFIRRCSLLLDRLLSACSVTAGWTCSL